MAPTSAYLNGVPDNQGLNAPRPRCAWMHGVKGKGEFHMTELVTVLRAADAAARWHVHQRRKGAAQEPYVTHLIEVAMLVAEATAGADPNLIVAALLHDTIEDQGVTREEIAAQFSDDVAALVIEVTDDKKLPKDERKRLQIKHAPKLTARAKILKLADKISNVRSMTTSPPADWPMQRRADYVTWTTQVVQGLRGTSGHLEQQFDRAAADWDRDRGIIE
jgi:(p)ppGpp synthase/HD superfamily hydrolase